MFCVVNNDVYLALSTFWGAALILLILYSLERGVLPNSVFS